MSPPGDQSRRIAACDSVRMEGICVDRKTHSFNGMLELVRLPFFFQF